MILMNILALDLHDIQGDVLVGLHKNAELFLFFKIADAAGFKAAARQYIVGQLTSAYRVRERERRVAERRRRHEPVREAWLGLNLGFSKDGMTQLLGARRPAMDPAFERGADHPETITRLNDPPLAKWLRGFRSQRIDGIFLIAGPNAAFVTFHGNILRERLGTTVEIVHAETGTVRPGRERGHEHFGFQDNLSQPRIRGLSNGLPGQDLLWPGEFVLGYPGQDPRDVDRPGPIAAPPAPWARNGSYMVFRRLEQRVPEFRRFVMAAAARLGIDAELLAARMVGRWRSGAPLERAALADNARLAADQQRNNDFSYAGDPWQRACPYAAHIRKTNPRDDLPAGKAATLGHRIRRAGIPFGPEIMPGETTTRHSRGLMFVCYQASIERQFEFVQSRWANDPDFVAGKRRPDSGSPVTPGFDPVIGQAPGNGLRIMDEPAPNYPAGNRRSRLDMPEPFVIPTAAGYFFMPSLTALRTALT